MSLCQQCAAPLVANTNKCRYCGTRNDVDLQEISAYQVMQTTAVHICPHCNSPLHVIDLNGNGTFFVEHCASCFGLFFSQGQIEALLNAMVPDVTHLNLQQLGNINKERYHAEKVKYIKCPVCQVLMNRVNFGQRSGVIMDRCREHGTWLDSGEMTHLVEWKKAGGSLLR